MTMDANVYSMGVHGAPVGPADDRPASMRESGPKLEPAIFWTFDEPMVDEDTGEITKSASKHIRGYHVREILALSETQPLDFIRAYFADGRGGNNGEDKLAHDLAFALLTLKGVVYVGVYEYFLILEKGVAFPWEVIEPAVHEAIARTVYGLGAEAVPLTHDSRDEFEPKQSTGGSGPGKKAKASVK